MSTLVLYASESEVQTDSFVDVRTDVRLPTEPTHTVKFKAREKFRSVVTMRVQVVAITFSTFRPQGTVRSAKCATLRTHCAMAAEWRKVAQSRKSQEKSQD